VLTLALFIFAHAWSFFLNYFTLIASIIFPLEFGLLISVGVYLAAIAILTYFLAWIFISRFTEGDSVSWGWRFGLLASLTHLTLTTLINLSTSGDPEFTIISMVQYLLMIYSSKTAGEKIKLIKI